jgi:hypothetical protein
MERQTNAMVCGGLIRASDKIAQRRMRLAGHLARHKEILTHQLVLWELQHGHRRRGRPHLTFVDILRRDTGLDDSKEINKLMLDRKIWKETIAARTLKPP